MTLCNVEWLRFVRTSKAKNRINAWLKRRQREKSAVEGRAIIEHELKKRSAEAKKQYNKKLSHILNCLKMHDEKELQAAVGYGRVPVESVMKALFGLQSDQTQGDRKVKGDAFALQSIENQIASSSGQALAPRASKTGIVVGKERNILLTFCKNCRPLHGESIDGVITKGNGIKVHRQGCKHLLEADQRRVIKVNWDRDSTAVTLRPVQLEVCCEDTPGVLARICNTISSVNFSIGSLSLKRVSHGRGLARLEVLLRTADDLEKVMTKIKQEEGIISVQRS
jgi:guanosine-3',5'-bis(diphosphate) 3'-pyrophosphohydrolase